MPKPKHFASMLENAACPKSSCPGFLNEKHDLFRCNICNLEMSSVSEWRQICILNSFQTNKQEEAK